MQNGSNAIDCALKFTPCRSMRLMNSKESYSVSVVTELIAISLVVTKDSS